MMLAIARRLRHVDCLGGRICLFRYGELTFWTFSAFSDRSLVAPCTSRGAV